MSKKLLYIVNSSGYFMSHRSDIATAARKQGYIIYVASPKDKITKEIESKGFIHQNIYLSRSSRRLFSELKTIMSLYKVIQRVKPDLIHLITIKPVIYGGIITSLLKIKGTVSSVPGLGFSYISEGAKASFFRCFLSFLYRLAFRNRSLKVIFQNNDDLRLLSKNTGLSKDKIVLIKGSGVNLSKFDYKPVPEGKPIVSMASRLQRDKGVIEFFEAAKSLKEKGVEAEFNFIGSLDSDYASVIPEKDILEWRRRKIINFLGQSNDINLLFQQSSIVVLPSYREGFPKVLQEAAACGRAIIASDVPGCRDAVKDGVTGLLVKPKDPNALAEKIEYLLSNDHLLDQMGKEARKLAEKEYSIDEVIKIHLKIYKSFNE